MQVSRRLLLALATSVLAVGLAATPAAAQEAIFLVRHAERLDSSTDSPLSADGQARAVRLAQMLRDARITAVVASEFTRTRDTARPLAEAFKLPIQQVPATDLDGLLAKVRAAGPRGRVLVVSHSDRVPAILAALGWKGEVTIASGDYDNLWVVLPAGSGKEPVVVRLHY